MIKTIKMGSVLLLFFLSSCASTPQTTENENRKLATAKINTQLGIAYLERQNVQLAKKKLLTALEEGPNLPETWYSIAYFYEATGNKAEASKHYLKSVSLAPKRGDVQNNYGTFLCRSGSYAAAIKHFLLAVKDNEYLDPADAYENAGLCALKIPNEKLALQFFNHAIMEDPKRPVSLIHVAELNYRYGHYAIAKQNLSQFLTLSSPTAQSLLLSHQLATIKDDSQFAENNMKMNFSSHPVS